MIRVHWAQAPTWHHFKQCHHKWTFRKTHKQKQVNNTDKKQWFRMKHTGFLKLGGTSGLQEWSSESGWTDYTLQGRKGGRSAWSIWSREEGFRKREEEGVAVWGMWGTEGGGEYHPLSQLWRGSGGWAAHRKQLWLHPRPHTEQLWATQSSTDRPTKWPGRAKPSGICLFFMLWWWG